MTVRRVALLMAGLLAAGCATPRTASRQAFSKIAEALETGDRALFHEYVDVESVVANGLDAVVQRQLRKDEELTEAGAFASGLIRATRPMLGALVTAKIDRALADPARRTPPRHGHILAVRKDGERTVARVELPRERDEPVQLDVILAPYQGHLRVVELDLAALMDELESHAD